MKKLKNLIPSLEPDLPLSDMLVDFLNFAQKKLFFIYRKIEIKITTVGIVNTTCTMNYHEK